MSVSRSVRPEISDVNSMRCTSFPRKRESRPTAPSRPCLDPRFHGGDAIVLKIREFFPDRLSARLSAIQAARQRVWRTRFSKAAGIVTVSASCRDMDKSGGVQSTRRTAAMASVNVGSCLRYHAAAFGRSAVALARARLSAHTAISENNPSKAGVVRRMARSDHWRWVSTPRWARTSWKVVSTRQRETNQPRIVAAVASRSVLRNADGSCSPDGSRTDPITQRIESFRCRPGAAARRAPEPGLHTLSCRLWCAGRAAAPDRAGRSCRGSLLVAVEETMDQRRAVRTYRLAARPRTPVHRFRGHVLGCPLAKRIPENTESRA